MGPDFQRRINSTSRILTRTIPHTLRPCIEALRLDITSIDSIVLLRLVLSHRTHGTFVAPSEVRIGLHLLVIHIYYNTKIYFI